MVIPGFWLPRVGMTVVLEKNSSAVGLVISRAAVLFSWSGVTRESCAAAGPAWARGPASGCPGLALSALLRAAGGPFSLFSSTGSRLPHGELVGRGRIPVENRRTFQRGFFSPTWRRLLYDVVFLLKGISGIEHGRCVLLRRLAAEGIRLYPWMSQGRPPSCARLHAVGRRDAGCTAWTAPALWSDGGPPGPCFCSYFLLSINLC